MHNVTKDELREYIYKRTEERIQEIKNSIKSRIQERIYPIIEKMLDEPSVKVLKEASQRFIETATKVIDKYQDVLSYSFLYQMNHMTNLTKEYGARFKETLIDSIEVKITQYVHQLLSQELTEEEFNGNQELLQAARDLYKECSADIKKIKDVETLRWELKHIIDNEPNGRKAYKALVAAGVDMKPFDEMKKAENNLPAVKLSVDVCLFNKTC